MLICLKVSVEWLETGTGWNPKNCGFSIYIGSIIGWTCWNNNVTTGAGSVMEIINSANITCSTWMLSITWSRLGSSFSSMLPYVIITLNYSPPLPPMSSE
jgi:hypothetical protein